MNAAWDADLLAANLRLELEEQTEEVHFWRIRTHEAEAEVRALKKRTRHADPAPGGNSAEPQLASAETGAPGPSSLRGSPRLSRSHDALGGRSAAQSLHAARPLIKNGWHGLLDDRFGHVGIVAGRSEVHDCGEQTDYDDSFRTAEVARLQEEVHSLRRAVAVAEASAAPQPAATASTGGSAPRISPAGDEPQLQENEQAAEGARGNGNAAATVTSSEDAENLERQLRNKDLAIVQLQADMGREKAQLERQRRQVEAQNIVCSEELQLMTERATALSDQVRKSKKKSAELQSAREEIAQLHGHVEESEVALSTQASAREVLYASAEQARRELMASLADAETFREEFLRQNAELDKCSRMSRTTEFQHEALEAQLANATLDSAEAREQHAAILSQLESRISAQETSTAGRACGDHPRIGELELGQCASDESSGVGGGSPPAGSTGRLHLMSECIGSLNSLHVELQRARVTDAAATVANGADAVPGERVMARLARQLDRAQQLLSDTPPSRQCAPRHEYDHPFSEGLSQKLSSDNNELQQQLNEYWIAVEAARQELMMEHSDELDDLARCHDLERRALHREVGELRAECSRAEVNGVAARPMFEIREHFEQQVAIAKRELIAQLSDLHERHRDQRGHEEREFEQLWRDLRGCRSEVAESREEFTVLATLFEEECRENLQLQDHQRALDLRAEAVAAKGSSYETTAETTGTLDILHVGAAERERFIEGAVERMTESRVPPVVKPSGSAQRLQAECGAGGGATSSVGASVVVRSAVPLPSSLSRPSSPGTVRASSAASPPASLRRGAAPALGASASASWPSPAAATTPSPAPPQSAAAAAAAAAAIATDSEASTRAFGRFVQQTSLARRSAHYSTSSFVNGVTTI